MKQNTTLDDKLYAIATEHQDQKHTVSDLAEELKQTGIVGHLFPFGSAVNGFATRNSDLDAVLVTDQYDIQALMKIVSKSIRKSNRYQVEAIIRHARIPIIKAYDKINKVSIDLSFNNYFAIVNSQLLKQYSSIHENIQNLGKLIKLWGNRGKMIDSSKFSSYTLLIMMIHFLQVKFELPNLQDEQYMTKKQQEQLEEIIQNTSFNPYFLTDNSIIAKISEKSIQLITEAGLSNLFKDFFKFYMPNGEYDQRKLNISISSVTEPKFNKISVIDPFNTDHDPASRISSKWPKYQEEFEESYKEMNKEQPNLSWLF